jgi:hypothetical protein
MPGQKIKQIFFIIFATIFLVTIPLVLLHTAGWSFNLKKNKFEKTGSLLVNTVVDGVTFSLDESSQKPGNEFRIPNLLTGE